MGIGTAIFIVGILALMVSSPGFRLFGVLALALLAFVLLTGV